MQEVGFYDSKPLICSLSCTKCGNMVNLNFDQNITQEYIMELSKTIMCINCNNNFIENQNIIYYINKQVTNIKNKNSLSFCKLNTRLNDICNNLINQLINENNIELYEKMEIFNELNEKIKFIQEYNKEIKDKMIDVDEKIIKINDKMNKIDIRYTLEVKLLNSFFKSFKNDTIDDIHLKISNESDYFDKIKNNFVVEKNKIMNDFNSFRNKNDIEHNKIKELINVNNLKYQFKYDDLSLKHKNINNIIDKIKKSYIELDNKIDDYRLKTSELKNIKHNLIMNDKEYKKHKNLTKQLIENIPILYCVFMISIINFFLLAYFLFK